MRETFYRPFPAPIQRVYEESSQIDDRLSFANNRPVRRLKHGMNANNTPP